MLFAIGMPSIASLVIILVIVLLLFGTKRLKNAGGDLGGAIKNFKDSLTKAKDDAKDAASDKVEQVESADSKVIDAEVKVKDNNNV
ncbi:twin-arginine translocase TatA/TatE family subunit [Leucothrix arctica]|uniref:Sec-independent protein translocase protein TatA n=1 Tax=Leucothrix arctica TaxID=1481894 RepID=A0A317CAT3_9GAMM|nr:twin-arginine translocase TatA/TatE family subunit [Leucothrix arctica]PWQ95734.1 twin-arginine translocase subunit TatA [Leucothrix arctica]